MFPGCSGKEQPPVSLYITSRLTFFVSLINLWKDLVLVYAFYYFSLPCDNNGVGKSFDFLGPYAFGA